MSEMPAPVGLGDEQLKPRLCSQNSTCRWTDFEAEHHAAANLILPGQLCNRSAAGNLYIGDLGDPSGNQAQIILAPANGSTPLVLNIPVADPEGPGR